MTLEKLFEKDQVIKLEDLGRDLSKDEAIEEFKEIYGIDWDTVHDNKRLRLSVLRRNNTHHFIKVKPRGLNNIESFLYKLNSKKKADRRMISHNDSYCTKISTRLADAGYIYVFGDDCYLRQELFSLNSQDYDEMWGRDWWDYTKDKYEIANRLDRYEDLNTFEKIGYNYHFKTGEIVDNAYAYQVYEILKNRGYIDYRYRLLFDLPVWLKATDLPIVESKKEFKEYKPEYLTEDNAINLAKEMGVNPSFLIEAVNCI